MKHLFNEHPELNENKKIVEKIVTQLRSIEAPLDATFKKNLDNTIQEKILEKKQQNPKYLAFYLHNFRFYFSGFSVALGCGLILFLLGFIRLGNPNFMIKQQKTFITTGSMAFGDLSFPQKDSAEFPQTDVPRTRNLGIEKTTNMSVWVSEKSVAILPKYRIEKNTIPSLPKSMNIAKEQTQPTLALSNFAKTFHIPGLAFSQLIENTINRIQLQSPDKNYLLSLDFQEHTLDLFKNSNEPKLLSIEGEEKKEINGKEIEKIIKKQLSDFGISLKNYGNAIITPLSEDGMQIIYFYPKKFEGKEIWNEDGNQQRGIEIIFDKEQKKIQSLQGFDFTTYILSSYPLTQTKETILEQLSTRADVSAIKEYFSDSDIPTNKGRLVYTEKEDYLVPSLLFETKGKDIHQNFVYPLF